MVGQHQTCMFFPQDSWVAVPASPHVLQVTEFHPCGFVGPMSEHASYTAKVLAAVA